MTQQPRPGTVDSPGAILPPGALLPPALTAQWGLPGPFVYDSTTARRVPAVSRALQLFGGLCKQMPMDAYRGGAALPRPNILQRPDPVRARSWFVQNSVEDYLLNGNTICLITSRGADGWPLSVVWLPITWCYIQWIPWDQQAINYFYVGQMLNFDDVIHVRRGADRWYPVRGVGVVEEHLSTLDRVAAEEEYERQTLAGSAVPSVAVIAPQANLTQEVAQQAKDQWMQTFAGPIRQPAVLPNGTQIVPLAWSPSDAQLTEARHMSLQDVANIFNLDGYWLGAPVAGMTYKSVAPQYQQILRTSLEGVLVDFEDVWSDAWLPRGQYVRFDRQQLLREDLATSAVALSQLVTAGIIDTDYAASYLGMPAAAGGAGQPLPITTPEQTEEEPGEEPEETTQESEETAQ
jgi:HK97 family phage portal protein